jgi:hypothetical protein
MRWDWRPGEGWVEVPTPAATETPVTSIGEVNVMWPPPRPKVPAPPGAADIMAVNGIQRPDDVIEYAAAAGLDLAAACTMLELESSGGHNVWGHDAVPTGGLYVKGAEVTQTEYLAYKARRAELGCQGVGPCQLTYYALQDRADDLGGCWIWENNVQVGFGVLANNIRTLGLHDGFMRYNGSGPAAQAYAAKAMARYETWQSRFADTPPPPNGDDDMAQVPQDQWDNVYSQLCGTFNAWGGGLTDDKNTPYDMLQFVMRNNVETHQLRLQVQALQDKLDALPTSPTGEPGSLSQADVNRIAAAVVALQKSQAQ